MNQRQRVQTVLRHQPPDKIPYQIHFTRAARQRMAEYLGDGEFTNRLDNCMVKFTCEPQDAGGGENPQYWRDQFGVVWDRTIDKDIGVVHDRLVSPDNIDDFAFPDPDAPSRFARIRTARLDHPESYIVVKMGFALYERAWVLAGMQDLMMAMYTDKPFVHRLLDRLLDFNLKMIDRVCQYDVDAIQFGDDWGQQSGLIMGIDLWHEFIGPRIREMFGAVKRHNKNVILHSCGKVEALFPHLIEYGLDVFNPFQPEAMDVFEMKREYGRNLCFYGGISTQQTLPHGTVQQTRDEVRRLLNEIGEGGGYIAAPAHDIPGDARPENIMAMIEELQNQ